MSNPHPVHKFAKGNPGKLPGTKNKVTLLKEKILAAALKVDLEGGRRILLKSGKVVVVPNVKPDDLMKIAATFVPKEQTIKGEGFETNITLANILGGEEVTPEVRRELIDALRARRGTVESA